MRKGSHASAETRIKVSMAKRGRNHPFYGKHRSPETKLKQSLAMRGIKNPNYGKHASAETRRKLSLSRTGPKNHQFGNPRSPEVRAKISAGLKGAKNPNYGKPRDDATVRKIIKSNRVKPNKAERRLEDILDRRLPNQWKFVGDGQVIIGGLCPDFINVNNKKMLLELYGSYWHSSKLLRNWKSTELGRIMHYNSYGFKCLIVWENELKDEENLVKRINSL